MKITNLTRLLLLVLLFMAFDSYCQIANNRGFSYFSEYNKQLVSATTVQKHVFSAGIGLSQFSGEMSDRFTSIDGGEINRTVAFARAGLGYHYLFLNQKKLTIWKKKRLEFSGFSVYANVYGTNLGYSTYTNTNVLADSFDVKPNTLLIPHYELKFTYSNAFLAFRGKMFSLYFLNEFGLSFFRTTPNKILRPEESSIKTYINVVPLSIRLGKRPTFFKFTFNVDAQSQLLRPEKINGNASFDLQIYFTKTKIK